MGRLNMRKFAIEFIQKILVEKLSVGNFLNYTKLKNENIQQRG